MSRKILCVVACREVHGWGSTLGAYEGPGRRPHPCPGYGMRYREGSYGGGWVGRTWSCHVGARGFLMTYFMSYFYALFMYGLFIVSLVPVLCIPFSFFVYLYLLFYCAQMLLEEFINHECSNKEKRFK